MTELAGFLVRLQSIVLATIGSRDRTYTSIRQNILMEYIIGHVSGQNNIMTANLYFQFERKCFESASDQHCVAASMLE